MIVRKMQDMPDSTRGEKPAPARRNIGFAIKRLRQSINDEDFQLQQQSQRNSDGILTARSVKKSIDAPLEIFEPELGTAEILDKRSNLLLKGLKYSTAQLVRPINEDVAAFIEDSIGKIQ